MPWGRSFSPVPKVVEYLQTLEVLDDACLTLADKDDDGQAHIYDDTIRPLEFHLKGVVTHIKTKVVRSEFRTLVLQFVLDRFNGDTAGL